MKIPKFVCRTVGAIALSLAAGTASATTLGLDLVSGGSTFDTDGLTNNNIMVGWMFDLSAPRTVSGLGYWDEGADGLLESHQVGIWDGSGMLVASGIVDNADGAVASTHSAGRWLVDALLAGVTLGPGSYTIGGLSTLAQFDPVREDTTIATDSALSFVEGRFIRDAGFANPTLPAVGTQYFGPTLLFTSAIPEPATLALFGIGLAGLGFARRRMRG